MSALLDPALDQLSARVEGSSRELLHWTRTQLLAGHAPSTLLHRMLETGWNAHVAQATLDAVQLYLQTPEEEHLNAPHMPGPNLAHLPSSIDVGDRTVQVLLSLQHPQLVLFGNLLSPEECDALIAQARPQLSRSLTVAADDDDEEINADRTSQGMFFTRGQTPEVSALEARIARLLQWPIDHGEGLQVLRYDIGAQYKPHHDYFDPQSPNCASLLQRGGQRVGTLVIYLNDVPQGGATSFPSSRLRIHPQRGNAVFFAYPTPDAQTLTLHAGEPVLAGEKWIATKWLRERTFQ